MCIIGKDTNISVTTQNNYESAVYYRTSNRKNIDYV